jgi:acyl-CoA dehydrogenase
MAKAYAGKAAVENANMAVQVYGGAGYSSEMPVEKLYRDSKIFEICEYLGLHLLCIC